MPDLVAIGITVAIFWFFYQWYLFSVNNIKVKHIPTVGPDGFITSYIYAWRFFFSGRDMIQEGCDKYGEIFKVPTITTPTRWIIILSGQKMVEDIRKASEEQLSFINAAIELLQMDRVYAIGNHSFLETEQYQMDVVRGPMTRNIHLKFDEINDEACQSLRSLIPPTEDWSSVSLHQTILLTICRVVNRLFIGLPLCQNEEYCRLQTNITLHTVAVAHLIHILPSFLKPVILRLINGVPKSVRRLSAFLGPMIRERMAMDQQYGNKWEGRPRDVVSWLLDMAPEGARYRTLEDLTYRIINMNQSGVYTSSMLLSNAIFDLAARQEYIAPLRAEVEEVVREYGWTKEGISKMHKLDSFMKESSRLSPSSAISLMRKAGSKDFTLSNGFVIPAGFRVGVSTMVSQLDESAYEDPTAFKGFRFVETQEGDDDFHNNADRPGHFRQMTSPDPNYLYFGIGRPACPGRFLATTQTKTLLAHILLEYDLKLPGDKTVPPPPVWFGSERAPNPTAPILFRKRQII